jgi:branched-chain amino acid transport system ATP-binding protein
VMMAIMNVAHRILVMHRGALLAQGAPAEIAKDPSVIGAYLGEKYVHAAR